MRMKSLLSACVLALAFNVILPTYAADQFSLKDVYQAAEAGNMDKAQAMMEQVLRDHPNSAKAHYVEAQLLAKQGKLTEAAAELRTAERLKPGLPDEKPQAVQALKVAISGQATNTGNSRSQEGQSGFGMGSVLLVLALVVFVFFIGRKMGRRNNPVVYPATNNGGLYGQQVNGGGMPMNGPAGGMGGGMGSGILGGLATGAALGAGMVAGQGLMHHFTDVDKGGGAVSDANAGDSWSDSNNMGGNDFGVTDTGSWDDGGGGDWT